MVLAGHNSWEWQTQVHSCYPSALNLWVRWPPKSSRKGRKQCCKVFLAVFQEENPLWIFLSWIASFWHTAVLQWFASSYFFLHRLSSTHKVGLKLIWQDISTKSYIDGPWAQEVHSAPTLKTHLFCNLKLVGTHLSPTRSKFTSPGPSSCHSLRLVVSRCFYVDML